VRACLPQPYYIIIILKLLKLRNRIKFIHSKILNKCIFIFWMSAIFSFFLNKWLPFRYIFVRLLFDLKLAALIVFHKYRFTIRHWNWCPSLSKYSLTLILSYFSIWHNLINFLLKKFENLLSINSNNKCIPKNFLIL
jgi:hypothetical protein